MAQRKRSQHIRRMRQRVIIAWIVIIVLLLVAIILYHQRFISKENQFNRTKHFEEKSCKHIYGDIAIVQVISGGSYINHTINNALQSVRCYATVRNYTLYQIRLENGGMPVHGNAKIINNACREFSSLMVRRHCIVGFLLQKHDYVIHLDGDTGVVNPNHCFEDFITPGLYVILLTRAHSGEIQAGNYIVKRSKFTSYFLKTWLRNSRNSNEDQEGLHKTLSQYFLSTESSIKCDMVLNLKNTYFDWVKCIVEALQSQSNDPIPKKKRVKIFNRAHGFARDAWITKHFWNDRDFLLHAMKYDSDILFNRTLTENDCFGNVWEMPLKRKYFIGNLKSMQRLWNRVDERQFKTSENYALIEKISQCWPYCLNILV